MVEPAPDPEADGEVERPHEQHVDPVHGGDGGGVLHRLASLDLDHGEQAVVGSLEGMRPAPVPNPLARIMVAAPRTPSGK